MNSRIFKVGPEQNGKRIDLALFELCGDLSRRKIRQILDVGGVYVNQKRIRIASRMVHSGDKLRMEYSLVALQKIRHKQFEFQQTDILYEDDDIIAINKPPGLPAQATKDQSIVHVATLTKALLQKLGRPCPSLDICHRLDKETSGVMILSKHKDSLKWMMELFKTQQVRKVYECLCYGIPTQKKFEVKNFLSSINPRNGVVSVVRSGGRPSFTEFCLMESFSSHRLSLVEAYPKTGRTHQIRVHLQSIAFPILGDKIYGTEEQKQLLKDPLAEYAAMHHMLHARFISFPKFQKNTESISIDAPRPLAFVKILDLLRGTQP